MRRVTVLLPLPLMRRSTDTQAGKARLRHPAKRTHLLCICVRFAGSYCLCREHTGKRSDSMRYKKKTVWAYLDGEKLVDVVQAALDNNMTVAEAV